jgi:arylsulfatase A-like enzyme/cytochrome c2
MTGPHTCRLVALLFLVLSGQRAASNLSAAEARPNVVVIVADDLGWGDIGYHNAQVKTPNLDRLAEDGVRLERFYANPTCSTTRSALLTGVSTIRTGVNNRVGLSIEFRTLPQVFRDAGYQTCMFGKWHLGGSPDNERSGPEFLPHRRGFDLFYGHLHGAIDYYRHIRKDTGDSDWQRNGQQLSEEGFSTDLLADAAVAQLKSRDRSKPVLLYLAFNAVHGPLQAPPSGIEQYRDVDSRKRQTLLANVTAMDTAIGRVLNTIDDEGIRENTLVVFFSDNGGQLSQGASNGQLRGEKGTVFEGGIRVPAAIRWPGRIAPLQTSQQLMQVADFLPTLTAATGIKAELPHELDGVNLWPAIQSGQTTDRPAVVAGTSDQAVFEDHWKLVLNRGGETLLFDIQADPFEQTDVAAEHPEAVAQLSSHANRLLAQAPPKSKPTGGDAKKGRPDQAKRRSGKQGKSKKGAQSKPQSPDAPAPATQPDEAATSEPPRQNMKQKGRRRREQTASENAFDEYAPTRSNKDEMVALASKGFTWLTGSPADNDVISVGKDAQFFGFEQFRYDSDHTVQRGVVGRTLYGMLSPEQRTVVVRAALAQRDELQQYMQLREQILRSLEEHLYTGIEFDQRRFEALGEAYGEFDARLGLIQARAIADIRAGFNREQLQRLAELRSLFVAGKGDTTPEASRERQQILYDDMRDLLFSKQESSYLEDMCAKCFSWLTGTPKANETLPVGKPAQFFGFVSLRLKSQHSANRVGIAREFSSLLDDPQRQLLQQTVTQQHPVVDEYLAKRREFLRELEHLLGQAFAAGSDPQTPSVDEDRVLQLGSELGLLDVQVAQLQAATYTRIRESLSPEQTDRTMELRSRNVLESDELSQLSTVERGARIYQLCASCHEPKAGNQRLAPPLEGIVNRLAGTANNFRYSAVLQNQRQQQLRWTPETLDAFLAAPQRFAPGTAMTFKGLLHPADRSALIEYLQSRE